MRRAEEELARGEVDSVFKETGSADARAAMAYRSALDRLAEKGLAPTIEFTVRGAEPDAGGSGGRRGVLAFQRARNGPLTATGAATALDAAPGGG